MSHGRRSGRSPSIESPSRLRSDSNGQNEKKLYWEPDNLNVIPIYLAPSHLVAALFHSMQTIFLIYVASSKSITRSIYTNFAVQVEIDGIEYTRPEQVLKNTYSISWLAPLFVGLAAAHHIACIVPYTRRINEYWIARNLGYFKWIEYTFSASFLQVMVAQLSGVSDIHTLVCVFFLKALLFNFGALHETLNAKARADGYPINWYPFFSGCISWLGSWGIVFSYYSKRLETVYSPGVLSSVILVLFFFEVGYCVVFVLTWAQVGRFRDFCFGEFVVIMLSFTVKSFCAWVTLAGGSDRKFGANI